MGTPYMSEIRICAFGFAPKGWALCSGQLLPINQNQALFSLLGTTYGGNGQTTFALPDLRSRVPVHVGNGVTQGERAGQEVHTLTQSEIPAHTHTVNAATNAGTLIIPGTNLLAQNNLPAYHATDANMAAMGAGTLANTGGSQPHENRQPYLALNFCIALQGVFPSQN